MADRKRWKIGFYYILILALIAFCVILLGFTILTVFRHFGIVEGDNKTYVYTLVSLASTSILLTAGAAIIYGKKIIEPITHISELSERVAKGDFNATLDARSGISELQTVIDSFNSMVKELAANESLSNDFVANVSHELKTPIAAIEGYATMLQDDSQTEEEKNEYIEKILFNTRRLAELTGNILLLSKLENQIIVTDKKNFSLDEQIRRAILSLEHKWTDKELDLDIDLDEIDYYGSEALLPTVWSNLIGNAVKFSPRGGLLGVSLKNDGSDVLFSVSDRGPGMSDEVAEHVFDKFYQGDKSHKSEGNGLGLTLVKRIITLCDGEVTVSSTLGKGTSFYVRLHTESREQTK